ncbi:MAG: SGNH/GDSL hydrolase family protein [Bryobacteraceae bacterium]
MRLSRWILASAAFVCFAFAQTSASAPKKPVAKKPVAPKPTIKKRVQWSAPASRKSSSQVKPAAVSKPKKSGVSASTRAEANEGVNAKITDAAAIPVENASALIPFFEQLYRHQHGEMSGPLRVLHYGDSHTAADELTGDLRNRFQQTFGDGGSGYSFTGSPWRGYRHQDIRTGSTRGWHTDGLVGRSGDGIYGLGGVSMTAKSAHESVYLQAECQAFELFYLKQPGGGSLQLYDNGNPVDQITTDGDPAPGYYRYETEPGPHRFELETLDRAPVRLFGWVAEKTAGVTYEPLGINGASASIVLDWNEDVLRSNIERRDPALIVLEYGTNEAGRKDWTLDTYRDMYVQLIRRMRDAAPAASILIMGPPDRYVRTRRGWVVMDNIDMIAEAQRQAAALEGCAFWDTRAKMGGKGAMHQWVQAGMAQNDHVHFTAQGYRLLADAVYRDVISQYDVFQKAREALAMSTAAVGTDDSR